MMTIRFVLCASSFAAALALTGCGSERFARSEPPQQTVPQYTGSIGSQIPMQGRWTLSSHGRGQCTVNVARAPGTTGGTLAPEGGCPGNFYMSRHWSVERSGLVLRDHTGQPLGQLSSAGSGRFEGRAATGEPITMSR